MGATNPTNAQTRSLHGARTHARNQAGSQAVTQATVPASDAVDLPDGVAPTTVFWDETLGAGGYAGWWLPRGSVLRITDTTGDACVNLQVYNAAHTPERLNPADTVKIQWQAYLGAGALLLSDLGRALMTVVADTAGQHDALCGHGTRALNDKRYGDGAIHGPHPNTRDLLALAGARHQLERRDLTSGINLFAGVRVANDGALALSPPAGSTSYVELRAELDVIILVAVGPHPLDDRTDFNSGTMRLTAWRGVHPDPDPFRTTSPERERAFQNSDQFLSGGAR